VATAAEAMQAAADALAAGKPGADDDYASGLERWLALGRPDLDERTDPVISGLGLTVSLDHRMTGLSGGQAARAGLASLLLSRYDVFLLDEPTNDLDLDGLDRLEAFVQGLRAGTVVVSHDREFLARTVTRVVELDLAQQQVTTYGGVAVVASRTSAVFPAVCCTLTCLRSVSGTPVITAPATLPLLSAAGFAAASTCPL